MVVSWGPGVGVLCPVSLSLARMIALSTLHTTEALALARLSAFPMHYQTDGVTPLYIACERGHLGCVQLLLDAGAAVDSTNVSHAQVVWVDCMGVSDWHPLRGFFVSKLGSLYE